MSEEQLVAAATRVQRIYKGKLQRARLRRTIEEALAASRLQIAWQRHHSTDASSVEFMDAVIMRDVVRVQRHIRRVAASRAATGAADSSSAVNLAHAFATLPSSMQMRSRAARLAPNTLAQRAFALADIEAAKGGGVPEWRKRMTPPDTTLAAASTAEYIEAVVLRDVRRVQRASRKLLDAHREATGGGPSRAVSLEDYANAFIPSSQVMRHRAACLAPSQTLAEYAAGLADRVVVARRAAERSKAAAPAAPVPPRGADAQRQRRESSSWWGCMPRLCGPRRRVAPDVYDAGPRYPASRLEKTFQDPGRNAAGLQLCVPMGPEDDHSQPPSRDETPPEVWRAPQPPRS